MRIAQAQFQLRSTHAQAEAFGRSVAVVQNRAQRPQAGPADKPVEPPAADPAAGMSRRLAARARALAPAAPVAPKPAADQQMVAEPDERQRTMLILLERMFGVKMVRMTGVSITAAQASLESTSAAAAGRRDPGGMSIAYAETYQRLESAALTAAGTVETADGRKFSFSMDYRMTSAVRISRSVSMQTAQPQDPLVLDLGGGGVRPTTEPWDFDLDGDGAAERLFRFAAGNRLLAIDRNADGLINDGGELFGPASGDGFADLRRLDGDGNRWIDEADADFARLRLWDGIGPPVALLDLGIGAISTVAAPFRLDHYVGGDPAARARTAGLFLREDGRPGVVQQVDFLA